VHYLVYIYKNLIFDFRREIENNKHYIIFTFRGWREGRSDVRPLAIITFKIYVPILAFLNDPRILPLGMHEKYFIGINNCQCCACNYWIWVIVSQLPNISNSPRCRGRLASRTYRERHPSSRSFGLSRAWSTSGSLAGGRPCFASHLGCGAPSLKTGNSVCGPTNTRRPSRQTGPTSIPQARSK